MSVPFHGFPLAPRRPGPLRVLVVCRISTDHQDARSLDDQDALCRRFVADAYPAPAEFAVVSGRGSGEYLDRDDLRQAEEGAASGRFDLVVVEDLGRVCRRSRAMDFCETCEDSATRFVAINDSIDTARDDWRLNAWFATFRHESANKDTGKRIRRSLRNRFAQGGVVQTLPYGYRKPPGAVSDAEIERLPEATAVVEGIFDRLEAGASYSEVADWLNEGGVSTGEWARLPRWNCRSVARYVANPILKGVRRRNVKVAVRVNRTGRRKSVNAPPGENLTRECPHLAFIDAGRYDRLLRKLRDANAHYARGRASARDARAGVARSRTTWPGQHARCGVCGRLFYWGGHGRATTLMCSGARDHTCWNGATFDGGLGAARLAAAVLTAVEALPEFDDAFRAGVEAEAAARTLARSGDLRRVESELKAADREVANLVRAVAAMGHSAALARELDAAEGRRASLDAERSEAAGLSPEVPLVPAVEELKARARGLLAAADFSEPGLWRELSALAPSVTLFPVRRRGGAAVELRARMTLDLGRLAARGRDALLGAFPKAVWVDLFDPPQRAAFRERVVALRSAGLSQRDAAARLGLTQPAVQAAEKLHREMEGAESGDPYTFLVGPEGVGRSNARHRHPRYRFDPSPGFPADPDAN